MELATWHIIQLSGMYCDLLISMIASDSDVWKHITLIIVKVKSSRACIIKIVTAANIIIKQGEC